MTRPHPITVCWPVYQSQSRATKSRMLEELTSSAHSAVDPGRNMQTKYAWKGAFRRWDWLRSRRWVMSRYQTHTPPVVGERGGGCNGEGDNSACLQWSHSWLLTPHYPSPREVTTWPLSSIYYETKTAGTFELFLMCLGRVHTQTSLLFKHYTLSFFMATSAG